MAQMSIRMDDEQYASLQAAARNAGNSLESWARDLLIAAAQAPVVRERYGYRGMGPGLVNLKRVSNHPGGTGATGQGWDQDTADAVKRAELLVRRNEAGDRESAVALLKEHFEIVVEVGV
jgi:hypothetical protein